MLTFQTGVSDRRQSFQGRPFISSSALAKSGDPHTLRMVEQTLQSMRNGGVYDQIGFGFHRYATDAAWRVPHFEKMLYDQALDSLAYTEAWQATGKDFYREEQRVKYSPCSQGPRPA